MGPLLPRWLRRLLGPPLPAAAAAGSSVLFLDGAREPRAAAEGPATGGGAAPDARRPRFLLAVDDGGELLVVCGREASLGHARGGQADVGLLADLDAVHVELRLVESFHGGAGWALLARGAATAGGDAIAAGDEVALVPGLRVELGPKLSFVFRRPDPASASAVLELEHGAEAAGARRVLLLAPGPEGRARIGPGRTRHVPVADLVHDVTLLFTPGAPDTLTLACAGGARPLGVEPAPELEPGLTLTLPVRRRVDLIVAARASAVPPFVVAFAPAAQ